MGDVSFLHNLGKDGEGLSQQVWREAEVVVPDESGEHGIVCKCVSFLQQIKYLL